MALAGRIFVGGSCMKCATASACRECDGYGPSTLGWRRREKHQVHVMEDHSTGSCRCREVTIEEAQ